MTEIINCPIWGTPAIKTSDDLSDGKSFHSRRTGGKFSISRRAEIILQELNDENLKAKLTSWLVEQRGLGEQIPKILPTTIDEAKKRRRLSVFERADQALKYIHHQTPQIGDVVGVLTNQAEFDNASSSFSADSSPIASDKPHYYNALKIHAYSESTNLKEVSFLLDYLRSQQWMDYNAGRLASICQLTVEGYARLAELNERDTKSSRAFVAMWLDSSMNDLWEKGIKPGIRDAGYDPNRIDKMESIDKIDDAIIAEIRRSRFIVVDFTHGDKGARGSVYYEAGFAHGMDIPVIFLCRNDMIDEIHFDTRQHKHIVWEKEKPSELREKLANRISAVIGDGPNKNDA